MQEKKINRYTLVQLLPVVLALFLLAVVCKTGNQIQLPFPEAYVLKGEYSRSGREWMALEEGAELSALDGDITIRGSFDRDIPEGSMIHYYQNHIAVSISVNGQKLAGSESMEGPASAVTCGARWESVESPGITAEDTVEIMLHNPHTFGNRSAYSDFLNNIYVGQENILRKALEKKMFVFHMMGIVITIISLVLLGVSFVFCSLHNSLGEKMINLGLCALFAGIYIMLDTDDVSMWSRLVAFNTYGLYLGAMLALFELGLYILHELTGKRKLAAAAVVAMEGITVGVIIILCLCRVTVLYDALLWWTEVQLLSCPVLFGCCIYEGHCGDREKKLTLYSCVLMLAVIFADLVNLFFDWWPHGICSKLVFFVLFLLHLARGVKRIPESFQVFIRAEKLEEELKNNRIVLAMSQIRAHFVFNVLNGISGMCKYDPEKADETVVRFARYLRTNIDIMQKDILVTFHAAMQHLEDYVMLEQIRFGDRIKFTQDITVDDFLIPSLVLQPIVENSIKHGLIPKPSGGTVLLRTWTDGENIFISIQDDGVGFDVRAVPEESAVGLNNVRFRLEHIMKGKMEIESEPGQGTTVTISLPCKEA